MFSRGKQGCEADRTSPETLLGYAIGMVRKHLHRELAE